MSKRPKSVYLEIIYTSSNGLTLVVSEDRTIGLPLFSIPLRRNPWHSTEILCEEILTSYGAGQVEEQNGRPTTAQLHHWQFHLVSPKPDHCEICARAFPKRTSKPHSGAKIIPFGRTEVRRIARNTKAIKDSLKPIARTSKSAEDLGF